jgi:hypothetical protein
VKQIIALGAIIVIIGVATAAWVNNSITADKGEMIGFAVSKVENGEQRMHIVVSLGMVRNDPPKLVAGVSQYEDWIAEKFVVREAAGGKPIRLMKTGNSQLIDDRKAANPEFFLEGRLKPKTKYIFEFKRFNSDTRRYRIEFTTRDDGIPFARETLKPTGRK